MKIACKGFGTHNEKKVIPVLKWPPCQGPKKSIGLIRSKIKATLSGPLSFVFCKILKESCRSVNWNEAARYC